MKQLRTLIKNVGSNVSRIWFNIIISFFLTPFILHRLGDADYGIWVLIVSITGYYGLLDLGIRTAVVRYVSKFFASRDFKSLNETISTCFFLFLAIGVICLAVSFIIAFFLPDIFNIPETSKTDFTYLVMILGAGVAVTFVAKVFDASITAMQRFDIINNIDICLSIIRAGLIVFFLSRGYRLVALGVLTLGQAVIATGIYIYYLKKHHPSLRISWSMASKDQFKEVANYSLFSFMSNAASHLIFYTDSLVIGYFLPVAAITHYAIGLRLFNYYKKFVEAATRTTTPVFSKYEATKEQDKMRYLLLKGNKYLALASMLFGALLILYGKAFIRLWVGEGYDSSYYIMLILTVPRIFGFAQGFSYSAFYGISKHKLMAYMMFPQGIINLLLSIILVDKYGIYGVAIGTAIPAVLMVFLFYPIYTCRIMGFTLKEYIRESFLGPSIIFFLFLAVMKYLLNFVVIDSFWSLFLIGGASLCLFAAPAVAFCVEKEERRMLLQSISLRSFRLQKQGSK